MVLMNASIEQYIQTRTEKQLKFFNEKEGNLLFFSEYGSGSTSDPAYINIIEGQTPSKAFPYANWPYDKEFIGKHAYDLGIQYVQFAKGAASYHSEIGDDWIPYIWVTWGTGGDTALLTGGEDDVVFYDGYSTFKEPVIKDWKDLDKLKLDLDNFWIRSLREFWRGVEETYDLEGVTVSPVQFRAPMDFANELRGNNLFYDFYDYPDEVDALIDFCTDSIIKIYRHLQEEFPILRNAPGGSWGTVFGMDTIWLNGDPVDLLSDKLGRRFFVPSIEKLVSEIGGILLHHHSIGYKKASMLSQIENLTLQEIAQDPNGPKVLDFIDDEMIAASHRVPIKLDANILEVDDLDLLMEKFSQGRFILYVGIGEVGVYDKENIKKYRRALDRLRKYFC
jgi:hypothetical protein